VTGLPLWFNVLVLAVGKVEALELLLVTFTSLRWLYAFFDD